MPIALLIGLIVMIGGATSAGLLLFLAGRADRQLEESRSWPTARATITSSRIRKGSKGQRWPSIRYRYSAQGQEFEGSRIAFISHSMSMNACNEVVSRYPIGRVIEIWYDPADPGFAVMERSANNRWYRIAAFGTIAVSLGVAILVQFVM